MGWEETEERLLLETFERLSFGMRFGMSSSSPLSHLERFREGVEDPARIGTIGISGLTVVGVRVTFLEALISWASLSVPLPSFFGWTRLSHVPSSRSTKVLCSSVSIEDIFWLIAPKISFHGRVIKPKFSD